MKDEPRWYVVGGSEWRLRSGDTTMLVWLDGDDETTYRTLVIRRPDGQFFSPGEFYELKEAKAACLETISTFQQEHLDDTA